MIERPRFKKAFDIALKVTPVVVSVVALVDNHVTKTTDNPCADTPRTIYCAPRDNSPYTPFVPLLGFKLTAPSTSNSPTTITPSSVTSPSTVTPSSARPM